MKINITTLSAKRIGTAIQQVQNYAKRVNRNAGTLARRLADIGQLTASYWYTTDTYYEPRTDANVKVTVKKSQNTQNAYELKATGKAVAFLEFGAGVTYSSNRHPWNRKVSPSMGPGTYPGSKHWNDPNGWYIPGSYDPSKKQSIRTLGNPPTKAMYNAFDIMRKKSTYRTLAQQIFK